MTGAEIKVALAKRAEEFASYLFPNGKRDGRYWCAGDIAGGPGKSFKVCVSGEKVGLSGDFATGDKPSTNLVDLYMRVRGVDFKTAFVDCAAWLGVTPNGTQSAKRTAPAHEAREPKVPELPKLERGSRADLLRLSKSRNLVTAALDLASERGLLWFYDSPEGRAWLITDLARRNAQGRRLDGEPWAWNGKKAWTLGGSCAKWPIGLPESEPFSAVALVEGGPDFLAALHHALASGVEECVAPVCIVGAGMSILTECLPAFEGKRVRVFVHNDPEGLGAALRWADQLRGIATRVDGFTFDGLFRTDGAPVKDLCDLASIDADSWEANRDAVENCMSFAMKGRVA